MNTNKVSEELLKTLRNSKSNEPLEVVVELDSIPTVNRNLDRSIRVEKLKESFSGAAGQIKAVINELGGKVIQEAWINQTLYARMPSRGVDPLSEVEGVKKVSLPHHLSPE
jgi:SMC interacting uncharacterized protein involved in chromosome segregation